MATASWKGTVLAESERVEEVEGRVYFPPESLRREHLRESATRTRCFWKGTASYYDLIVDGEVNPDAAWYYPDPSVLAKKITGHVAFWKGVTVTR